MDGILRTRCEESANVPQSHLLIFKMDSEFASLWSFESCHPSMWLWLH